MTAADVASLCPGSYKASDGYRAPCPAHGGRKRNLIIREGRAGNVLIRCMSRNCDLSAIVAALGITVSDLFASPLGEHERRPYQQRVPSQDEIRLALTTEETCYRQERRILNGERLVATDLNKIRHAVASRFGISLPPITALASDSWCGGRERDPLWPVLLERAWFEAWVRYDGREPCCTVDDFAAHGEIGIDLFHLAEIAAAREIRSMARQLRVAA